MASWHNGKVTRRALGSNQYRVRIAADLPVGDLDLLSQAAATTSTGLLCQQVWGGICTEPVRAPRWVHTSGGRTSGCAQGQANGARKNVEKLPITVLKDIVRSLPDGYRLLTAKDCPSQLGQWAVEQFYQLCAAIPDWQTRHRFARAVLDAPWCSLDLQQRLISSDPIDGYATEIIRRGRCPAQLLHHLLDNKSPWMRTMAARQECVNEAELTQLAQHPDPDVRAGVGFNPRTPVQVLEQLARDTDGRVQRAALSQGHRLAQSTLVQLAIDAAPHISRMAAHRVDMQSAGMSQIVSAPDARSRAAVAARHDCPPHLLSKLANDSQAAVRAAVGFNQSCPPQTLERLAQDRSVAVRRGVAWNPQCPPQALVTLMGDRDTAVRQTAARHANLPEEYQILIQLRR